MIDVAHVSGNSKPARPPRPEKLTVIPQWIPQELKARCQWVCWRWIWKAGKSKWDKPPLNARTGRHASSTDRTTWSSFDVAYAAYLDPANDYSGIGYVFSGDDDDVMGVDLDHCRDPKTGEILPWTEAQIIKGSWQNPISPADVIAQLATYAEVSPSGTGVKLLLRGHLAASHKAGDFEAYNKDRYFTVTGVKLPDSPEFIRDVGNALTNLEPRFFAKFQKTPAIAVPDAKSPTLGIPQLPCAVCGSTDFWMSIYTDQIRCCTCDPVVHKALLGKLLKLENGQLVEQPVVEKPSTPRRPQHKPKANTPGLSATDVIRLATKAHNGAKFQRLFDGDISEYPSHSEADGALCSLLAFFAGPHPAVIDEAFRQSKLYRDKWDEIHSGEGSTYGQMTIAGALALVTEFYNPRRAKPLQSHVVGNLELVPVATRRTKTKTIVDVQVKRDGTLVDLRQITSADSNRKAAIEAIAEHLTAPDAEPQLKAAVAQILLEANQVNEDTDDGSEKPTIHQVLVGIVPMQAAFKYRVDSRAFSEVHGYMSRTAFLERFTNNDIVGACVNCEDVGVNENGDINRGALISLVERELKLLWGDLLSKLPTPIDAEVGSDSKAAEEFRAALIRIWAKPTNMQMVRVPTPSSERDGMVMATRNSLISRLVRANGDGKISQRQWTRVQEGFDAWARLHPVATERVLTNGEVVTETVPQLYLAMRWQLATQISVTLPNVNNQTALHRLGEKFGCIDATPPMSTKTSDGQERLAVLSRSVTDELLYLPLPDDDAATDS